jgi:predicted transcriptional regulator
MIQEILQTLGFGEDEAKTYLTLLDSGTMSAGDLAKLMGIKRPTAYVYLDRLIVGGLVAQSLRRGVKVFAPEPPEKIQMLYRRKIDELKTREKSLQKLLPQLNKRAGLSLMRPRIQVFEGRDGMETALQDNLSYPGVTMLTFWPIKKAIEATSEEFFHYLNKERIKRGIWLTAIWPSDQGVDIKRYPFMGLGPEFKRDIRLAPKGIDSTMGYWIYANKVLFASSRAESFCFIIESTELVQMMSVQHKAIWEISKPITAKPEDMKPFLDDLYAED